MPATRLGKRSRQVLDIEEILLPLPARKRTTRVTTPQIYEDKARTTSTPTRRDVQAKQLDRLQNRGGSERNSFTKCNAQNQATQQQFCLTGDIPTNVALPTDENANPFATSTPTSIRFKDVIDACAPSTPKHRVRLGGRMFTPRSNRFTPTSRSQNVFASARQLFTQACNPVKFIGRDEERNRLDTFISSAVSSQKGGSLYVSGPPGTGKSALVQEVLLGYQSQPSIKVAVLNCVALKSSNNVFGKILEEFCNDTDKTPKSAKQLLAKTFIARSKSNHQSYLLLLDEMDSLLDGDAEALYNLFEWAMHPSSSLILVGIANALDLTDRFLPRLKMRNLKPELLPFLPYSAAQISEIISGKLRSLLPDQNSAVSHFVPLMHPAAIQLSGKKIASQTGDLRKAFNLVRRVIDQLERETNSKETGTKEVTPTKGPLAELPNLGDHLTPTQPELSIYSPENAPRATVAHVARMAASMFNNGAQSRLGGLNLQQKAVLCSLVATENKRPERDPYTTPSKAWSRIPTMAALFEKYTKLCQKDDGLLQRLKATEFRDVVASLETLGLVHESSGRPTGLLTPSRTPSRMPRNPDDKQLISAVSEKELRESLTGPAGELLQRLFDD